MGVRLQAGDALLIVHVQADFVGGALPVPGAAGILPVLNEYIAAFTRRRLPVIASRDWHPANHASFREFGGRWPPHCVAGSPGAQFAKGLKLPRDAHLVSTAATPMRDAYSAFDDTTLHHTLSLLGVRRLFVGGLATDYCVQATVLDARELGYEVFLLVDAIRAIDANPGDGHRAHVRMVEAGATPLSVTQLQANANVHA